MLESLRKVDLNLLVVFDTLFAQRSVTAASEKLGMTQPAVSLALGRLRHVFHDPLFVRAGGSMIPTSRAMELAQPIHEALRLVEGAFAPAPFDPTTADRIFHLALSDAVVLTILPRLMKRLMAIAPGVSIETLPKALPSIPNMLDRSQVDLAAGVFTELPPRFESVVLFHDSYVCLMREDHPLRHAELTVETIAAARHVLLRAVPNATARLDEILPQRGLRRDVAVTVNQSAAIPEIVQNTDLLAVILTTTANSMSDLDKRKILKRRVAVDPIDIRLVWHSDSTRNPASSWLRKEIVEAAGAAVPARGPARGDGAKRTQPQYSLPE